MTAETITVPPDMPLAGVLQTLQEHRIKRVVVADAAGRLMGMIDRDMVLRSLAGK
jgi:CBS domain-containing protein